MRVSASEKFLASISNSVKRAAGRGLPVDGIDVAVQIQRDNPHENVMLEDIVEEFELQAVKAGVALVNDFQSGASERR